MKKQLDKIYQLALLGLTIEDPERKQWYLEKILENVMGKKPLNSVGGNLHMIEDDVSWKAGKPFKLGD